MSKDTSQYDDLAKALGATSERKLHPLSWVFLLLDNLWSYSIPIIFYLIFSPEDGGFGMIVPIIIILAIVSAFIPIAHFLSYRFTIVDDEVRLRWGILNKQARHIRLNKIHNVSLRRNLLHRILDVAEVRLESAGSGAESEALLRVLSLEDARLLEGIIDVKHEYFDKTVLPESAEYISQAKGVNNHHTENPNREVSINVAPPLPTVAANTVSHTASNSTTWSSTSNNHLPDVSPAQSLTRPQALKSRTLLTLEPAELVRYGVISNTGLVIGGLATVFLSPERLFSWLAKSGVVAAGAENLGAWSMTSWVLALSVFSTVIILGGKVFSVLSAFVTHYNFVLTDSGRHLTVEKGLITREKSHVPLEKVQVWRISETFLHRMLKRLSVHIDTAMLQGAGKQSEGRGTDEVIPLAVPDEVARLLKRWSGRDVDGFCYTPVHPKAWQRLFFRGLLLHGLVAAVLSFIFGAVGLLWLTFLAVSFIASKRRAAFMGVLVGKHVVAWRDGWLNKRWYVAQTNHVHALRLTQSPFDRRYNMATLTADTVGGRLFTARFVMPYLPKPIALQALSIIQRAC